MTSRRSFNSATVPRFSEVFPQAVVSGGLIFVSGTVGIDPETKLIHEDFEEQAIQVFKNIQSILEELGSSLSKVVKTTVFMVSGNDFAVLNKVYATFFPNDAPARSTPQVMPFPSGIKISVECIAEV